MNLMSISQYARHAGMSRQALYNWEAKQGFPARVDGKIDQAACDQYLARYRDSRDPRIKNNIPVTKAAAPAAGQDGNRKSNGNNDHSGRERTP